MNDFNALGRRLVTPTGKRQASDFNASAWLTGPADRVSASGGQFGLANLLHSLAVVKAYFQLTAVAGEMSL